MTPHEHVIEETAKREKAEERATAALLALELMHEIRNPLDALDNLLYLSFQKAGEPETVRSYLRLAREQTATEPNFCKRIRFREVFAPAQVNLSRGGGRGSTPHSPKNY
jgi:nitrogen-specific signal transduction histidine kinase